MTRREWPEVGRRVRQPFRAAKDVSAPGADLATLEGAPIAVDNAAAPPPRTPSAFRDGQQLRYDAIYGTYWCVTQGSTTTESYYVLIPSATDWSRSAFRRTVNNTSNELTSIPARRIRTTPTANHPQQRLGSNTTTYAWDSRTPDKRDAARARRRSPSSTTRLAAPLQVFPAGTTSVYAYDGDNLVEGPTLQAQWSPAIRRHRT